MLIDDFMYQITIYSGGLYKFNEFKEFIDDLGGLVLKRDKIHLSRGEYFLSEEVHAFTIIPEEEVFNAEIIAKNIKGTLNIPDIDKENKIKILSCLDLHNLLSRSAGGLGKEAIENNIKCPCSSQICLEDPDDCIQNYLDEILEAMVQMEMIETQKIKKRVIYKIIINP